MTAPNHNYFEVLGLQQQFSLDLSALDNQLAQMQASVHPDNSAQATNQEKRLMMQFSAILNEAYVALKCPISRAKHILELEGLEIEQESGAMIPPEFLHLQMELREQLEDIKQDEVKLKEFLYKTERNNHLLLKDLAKLLDNVKEEHLVAARELFYNLQFFQKLILQTKDYIKNQHVQES